LHDDALVATRKKKTTTSKTYVAYQVSGIHRHASPPIPFLVSGSTFKEAKEAVIADRVAKVSQSPHGFISVFFIRPGGVGDDADLSNVAALLDKRRPGDRHVATVDRKRDVIARTPGKSRKLPKGMVAAYCLGEYLSSDGELG
jgi:hypothetical protein